MIVIDIEKTDYDYDHDHDTYTDLHPFQDASMRKPVNGTSPHAARLLMTYGL